MIAIHACTGYKYFGGELPLTKDTPWYQYRDNMTYLCVEFSDWASDQEMLRFVIDTHVPSLEYDFLSAHIATLVEDNKTPQLHIVVFQNDHFHGGGVMFSIALEMPFYHFNGEGQELETPVQHIGRKQALYAGEMARRQAELNGDEQKRYEQEKGREERLQKKLAKEAKDDAQQ